MENVDVKDNAGYTALMFASFDGNISTVKALLDKGADIKMKNSAGQYGINDGVLQWAYRDRENALGKRS